MHRLATNYWLRFFGAHGTNLQNVFYGLAAEGNASGLRLLLNKVDIDANTFEPKTLRTALMFAAMQVPNCSKSARDILECAIILIKSIPDDVDMYSLERARERSKYMSLQDINGMTALMYLIDNPTLLNASLEECDKLIDWFVDFLGLTLPKFNNDGESALMKAVKKDNDATAIKLVRFLFCTSHKMDAKEAAKSTNAQNGYNAIFYAITCKHVQVIEFLEKEVESINYGSNIYEFGHLLRNVDSWQTNDMFSEKEYDNVLETKRKNIVVEDDESDHTKIIDKEGKTALIHLVANMTDLEILDAEKKEYEEKNDSNNTSLKLILAKGDEKGVLEQNNFDNDYYWIRLIKLWRELRKGGNPFHKDKYGKNAFDYAQTKQLKTAIIEALKVR